RHNKYNDNKINRSNPRKKQPKTTIKENSENNEQKKKTPLDTPSSIRDHQNKKDLKHKKKQTKSDMTLLCDTEEQAQ
ncbi:hypothetical protein Q4498_18575, partial [Neptunomonas phycophila]|uniref:hypothetical protein n=1 Tax=Neptunomonas phycophila TaxID=1572645 RepID=UPI0026E44A34